MGWERRQVRQAGLRSHMTSRQKVRRSAACSNTHRGSRSARLSDDHGYCKPKRSAHLMLAPCPPNRKGGCTTSSTPTRAVPIPRNRERDVFSPRMTGLQGRGEQTSIASLNLNVWSACNPAAGARRAWYNKPCRVCVLRRPISRAPAPEGRHKDWRDEAQRARHGQRQQGDGPVEEADGQEAQHAAQHQQPAPAARRKGGRSGRLMSGSNGQHAVQHQQPAPAARRGGGGEPWCGFVHA